MSAIREAIKQFFETRDYPTQGQFYTAFNGIRFNDEPIGVDDLTDELVTVINNIANPVEAYIIDADHLAGLSYTIPDGFMLEEVVIRPQADRVCSLKNFDAEEEDAWIFQDEPASAAAGRPFTVKLLGTPGGEMPLVFYGGGLGDKVSFIKRKIEN